MGEDFLCNQFYFKSAVLADVDYGSAFKQKVLPAYAI